MSTPNILREAGVQPAQDFSEEFFNDALTDTRYDRQDYMSFNPTQSLDGGTSATFHLPR